MGEAHLALDGYEFSLKWPSESGSGEMVERRFIAIAKTVDDAAARAREKAPRPCSAKLLDSGPNILKRAEARGMSEGDAEELRL